MTSWGDVTSFRYNRACRADASARLSIRCGWLRLWCSWLGNFRGFRSLSDLSLGRGFTTWIAYLVRQPGKLGDDELGGWFHFTPSSPCPDKVIHTVGVAQSSNSKIRSFHSGLCASMSAIFQSRFHFLRAFSRAMASVIKS